MQLPLSAFLMTRDLSWLTCCSASCSIGYLSEILPVGVFSYGSDELLQFKVASSRGVPGGHRFERMLRSGG